MYAIVVLMTLTPEICLMQKDDLPEIFKLMVRFYEEEGYPFDPERHGKALEKLMEEPSIGYAWTLRVNGDIAGYAVLSFGYSVEFGGRTALFDEIYVKEGMRGKGIGTAAMNFLLAKCDELGIRVIDLEVEKSNVRAQKFYTRHNFREGWRILMRRWNRR